jgi:hypothetical protein
MLLKSGEAHLQAEALAEEVKRIYDEEEGDPFPYEGCRWLKSEFGDFEGLTPDLNTWQMDVAGHSSLGKKVLSWPAEKVLQSRGALSLSFFEKHPEYALLERHITESETPDLFDKLRLYERMRMKLLELYDFLLAEEYRENSHRSDAEQPLQAADHGDPSKG